MMLASQNDDAVAVLQNGIRLFVRFEARRRAACDQQRAGTRNGQSTAK
jgi:hypothetical protein